MSFYDPENITDPFLVDHEKANRFLQPVWDFVKRDREDLLRSPLFPPILGISFYIIITVPFTVVDLLDLKIAKSWLLQKNRTVTWRMLLPVYANAFWNHVLLIIPMALVQMVWVPPTPLPPVAPTVWQFVWHISAFFLIFDFLYWIWHIVHHKVRILYRWCHSVHHQYHSTFAVMTQYMHPWEVFSIGMVICVTPWLFRPHCLTYWCWFIVANWVSIEAHCGYDLPWGVHKWCPLYGGAPKHDAHHIKPMTNFEPWLNYLDRMGYFEKRRTKNR